MLPFRKHKAGTSNNIEGETVLGELQENQCPAPNKWKRFIKRFGLLIFLFYLLKGIFWLVLFFFGGKVLLDKFFSCILP